MLERVKLALRLTAKTYDAELLDLIEAALADIRHAGAVIQYTAVTDDETGAVTDYTVPDALTRRAVVTYVCSAFGEKYGDTATAAFLWTRYEGQKGQMRESRAYGMEAL